MSGPAYFIGPSETVGPGLLLMHSWWGSTPAFRRVADRFAGEGFTVVAPDLFDGETFLDAEAAEAALAETDPNLLATRTLDALRFVAARSASETVSIVGFSMGASLGLWASIREAELVHAVVGFYGTQSIDFVGAAARYQFHYAASDHLVVEDDAVFMEATIGLVGLEVESHTYPAGHWFFESDRPEYHEESAEIAWERTVSFLTRDLRS